MKDLFHKLAVWISNGVGSSYAFVFAIVIVVVWIITGPIYRFSDSWQLVINTATNVITFFVVFLIQNTQNRDSKALQIKLDALLTSTKGTRTDLVDLEELSDEEIEKLQQQFRDMHIRYSKELERRKG